MSEFDEALNQEGFSEDIDQSNIFIERPIKETSKKNFSIENNIFLPPFEYAETKEYTEKALEIFKHVNENSSVDEIKKFEIAKSILEVYTESHMSEYFKNIFARENSEWRQGLLDKESGEYIRHSRIIPKESGSPADYIKSQLNIGNKFHVPLYRSGFWLTLRNPNDCELYDLEHVISQDKVNLGYLTNGFCFSSAEVYQTENMVDFILKLYVSCTVSITDVEELRGLISLSDFPLLVHYLACAIYPKGYPLKQPCLANPEHCDQVVQELINLNNLIIVDNTKLTNAQLKHLKRKTHKYTVEEIKAYQDGFAENEGSYLQLNENTKLKFGVPSLKDAIEIGQSWVMGIQSMAQKAFTLPNQGKKRSEYVKAQTFLSQIKQYSHWIKSVICTTGDNDVVASERSEIEDILTYITNNNDLATACFEKIKNYIDYTTIAVIAIPKYECPKCNGEPDEKALKHPKLIPLDPLYVFFILRLQLISRRIVEEAAR